MKAERHGSPPFDANGVEGNPVGWVKRSGPTVAAEANRSTASLLFAVFFPGDGRPVRHQPEELSCKNHDAIQHSFRLRRNNGRDVRSTFQTTKDCGALCVASVILSCHLGACAGVESERAAHAVSGRGGACLCNPPGNDQQNSRKQTSVLVRRFFAPFACFVVYSLRGS